MTTINFSIVPLPHPLRRDVECIRVANYSGDEPLAVKVCPSGYPGIVFQLAEDGSAAIEMIAIRTTQTSSVPILFLHGQGSEPSIMSFRGAPYMTIFSVLGWDASDHSQGLLAPEQFGAAELEGKLLKAHTLDERIQLLNRFLMKKLDATNKRDDLIETMLDYIRDNISSISVNELLHAFPISERQFQKRFARVVGMPPRLYIRIRRINEALRMMHSGQYERLSDVALALNYYDQSHFIRDMKLYSWVSPRHIAMKVSEFHSDLAGSSYL